MRANWKSAAMAVAMAMTTVAGAQMAKYKPLKVEFKKADGTPAGTAIIKPLQNGGIRLKLELKGLPDGEHGFHIHEHADCTGPDFKSAGGHFNPTGKHHGFENPMGHHAGDTPSNLVVKDGKVKTEFDLTDVTLDPLSPNSLFAGGGTSLVIHGGVDDEKSDPAGNAGPRIACAVITQP
ncbi:superoxide dismutase family protein [Granulicella cerasi]|uniref:Superoxide dismutase [Cu-Zn] n=1 Tax=Granulicella cerasi TaxID=741063 RepID=A0ABW1ZCX0_9BACT|nr:superoxide dismutase family protein [Granulicella cerasi]